MQIVLNALLDLGFILIFPGFLFCILGGLLLEGFERKTVARMQKRVGPPIIQPFYDFFKLCGKETIIPARANKAAFLAAPIFAVTALAVVQLFIPISRFTAFSGKADIIVVLYLLLIPAVAEIVGAASSGSPYAGVGLSREMVKIISCELPIVLVLLAVGRAVGNAVGSGVVFSLQSIAQYQVEHGCLLTKVSMLPAAIAFLLVIPAEIGAHPFDAAEAETEICEGMLAEYSGPALALFKLAHAMKILTLTSLFAALFLGGLGTGVVLVDALIVFAVCLLIAVCVVALINAITARLKIEQLFKYYWTVVASLAAISLVLAWYGL